MTNYILFDGACGFCNTLIMCIAKNDTHKKFTFVSSLSCFGIELLTKKNLKGVELKTIILLENENDVATKSSAIQKILLNIPRYKAMAYLMFLLPKCIKDYSYDIIAKRRKKIIKNHSCKMPSLEIRQKFILE